MRIEIADLSNEYVPEKPSIRTRESILKNLFAALEADNSSKYRAREVRSQARALERARAEGWIERRIISWKTENGIEVPDQVEEVVIPRQVVWEIGPQEYIAVGNINSIARSIIEAKAPPMETKPVEFVGEHIVLENKAFDRTVELTMEVIDDGDTIVNTHALESGAFNREDD